MSYRATAWAYRQDVKPSGAKFVLVALADYADEENSCYPGQKRLAFMTGQSVATVARHLQRLEEAGLLRREHRQATSGHRTSDRYWLAIEPNPADCGDGPTLQSAEANPAICAEPTLQFAGGTISRSTSRTTSARRRATALPDGWQPTTTHVQLAAELGLDVGRQVEAFKAHALAQDRRVVLWDQAFRQWLLLSNQNRPTAHRSRKVNGREVEYD